MDHLPKVHNPVHTPIEVPCYFRSEHKWDGQEFEGFLSRKGLPAERLVIGDFGSSTREEVLSIVQSWAFFGTLFSIGKIARVSVNINDFVRKSPDGRLMITTEILFEYLRIWIYNERSMLSAEDKEQRAQKVTKVLRLVATFIDDVIEYELKGFGPSSKELVTDAAVDQSGMAPFRRAMKEQYAKDGHYHEFEKIITDNYYVENRNFFTGELGGDCYPITDGEYSFKSRAASPSHMLILSLSILGEALTKARDICYEKQPSILWRTPMFLSILMHFSGWCSVDVRRVCATAGHSMSYYLSSLDRRPMGEDHDRCCGKYCVAFQINSNTYKGKHTTTDCECDFMSLRDAFEFVKECLDEDSIPLIRFEDDDEETETATFGLARWKIGYEGPPYVAISHIWADGIGNTQENALPLCQMRRLQKMVNELYPESPNSKTGVLFWIDTLMVPLEDEARKKAIAQMEAVYRCANKVLVLDKSLETLRGDLGPEELLTRISYSPWMKRLWTAQEAYLAGNLHFQLLETSVSIRGLTGEYRRHKLELDMDKFKSICHDGSAFAEVLTHYFREIVQNVGQPTDAEGDLQSLDRIKTHALDRLVPLRIEAWSKNDDEEPRDLGLVQFIRMVLPMQNRSSSKAEDEPLCLALLAGAPVSAFLPIPPDERMEQLFGNFAQVPGNIIFSEKVRINKYARRWIPTSLLDSQNIYSGPPGTPTPDGLIVTYPGIVLGPYGDYKLFSCRHTSPDGIFCIKYPDRIASYKFTTRSYQIIPEERRGDGSFGHDPVFGIHTHSDVNYQHFAISEHKLALILEGENGEDDWKSKKRSAALVAISNSWDDDIVSVEFVLALWLEQIDFRIADAVRSRPMMEAIRVFDAQKWCVG